jgi:hypothetical protein
LVKVNRRLTEGSQALRATEVLDRGRLVLQLRVVDPSSAVGGHVAERGDRQVAPEFLVRPPASIGAGTAISE